MSAELGRLLDRLNTAFEVANEQLRARGVHVEAHVGFFCEGQKEDEPGQRLMFTKHADKWQICVQWTDVAGTQRVEAIRQVPMRLRVAGAFFVAALMTAVDDAGRRFAFQVNDAANFVEKTIAADAERGER